MRKLTRWNPGNVLLTLGLVLIGFLLAVPDATGRRVARIENRAERTAELLLACAQRLAPLELAATATATMVEQALQDACRDAGFPQSDLPLLRDEELAPAPRQPVLLFSTKHYWFMLARVPPAEAGEAIPPGAPLEVLAWPQLPVGGGHTAFVFGADRAPAFSRNLVANYHGTGNAPLPGQARPRRPPEQDNGQTYFHGHDDERWIVLEVGLRRTRTDDR